MKKFIISSILALSATVIVSAQTVPAMCVNLQNDLSYNERNAQEQNPVLYKEVLDLQNFLAKTKSPVTRRNYLTQNDVNELIEKKLEKEANRYIQQWPAEKISLENGRWGAFIKFGKNMLKLGKKADGTKHTPEELTTISLDEIKKMIEDQLPDAFKKNTTVKKKAAKKVAPKKK